MNDAYAQNVILPHHLQDHPSRHSRRQGPGNTTMSYESDYPVGAGPQQHASRGHGPQQGYEPEGYGPRPQRAYVADEDYDQEERYGQPQEDERKWACDAFAERARRMAFVRKVLGIVALQLAVTAAVTALCIFYGQSYKPNSRPPELEPAPWILKYWWLGFLGAFVWMGINLAVACCGVGRGPPSCLNVTLLIVATMGLSILCGFVSTRYNVEVVIYALSTTVGILLILVIITVFTKIDITGWGIYLMVAGLFVVLASIVAGLVFGFGGASAKEYALVKVILSFVMVLLLCFYILYDLQLIMGGRKYQLEEDDWLFACLMLFGDIVYLFMHLLEIYNYFNRG